MMGNEGIRLNLVFGKEIKGENRRNKRKVLEERRGLFLAKENPRKRAGDEETREKRREKGKREQNPSQTQHHFD